MPLDSQRLPKDARNYLHELPLDDDCKDSDDVYYQTKVDIYEKNCNDCGFCTIMVDTVANDGRGKKLKYQGVGAVDKANRAVGRLLRCEIRRTCSYPHDITIVNNDEKLPTLSEIISNTCQFWRINELNIPADNKTEFIEWDDINKMEKLVERADIIKEGIPQE